MACRSRSSLVVTLALVGCYDPTENGGNGSDSTSDGTTFSSMSASSPTTTAPTSGATMGTTFDTSPPTTTTDDDSTGGSSTAVVDSSSGPGDPCAGLVCGRVDGQSCGTCSTGECVEQRACCTPASVLGTYDTAGTAVGIDVDGVVAYVADFDVLRMLDVSDPAGIVELGTESAPSYAWDVRASAGRAYVAWAYAGLVVVDVAVPSSPSTLGADANAVGTGVAIDGDYAYVAGGAGGTFYVVDVANPAIPAVVGTLPLGQQTLRVEVAGGYAYLPVEYVGVRVVDLADPSLPVDVGLYEPRVGLAHDIAVSDTVAWASIAYEGVVALDVTDPSAPSELGRLEVMDGSGTLGGLEISGTIAAVADGSIGVRFVDISDPAAPFELGTVAAPDARDLVIADGLVYVATGTNGITVASLPVCER